jgi:hypothetical protein
VSWRAAIVFVLAEPAPERPFETARRKVSEWLRVVPLMRRFVRRRWSPERRLGYGAGLHAAVNSLRRRHESLPPILLLRPRPATPTLADVDEIVEFDPGPYSRLSCHNSYFGREVFYKLEIFNLQGFDRLVYLDCDTVVLGDISALWDPVRYCEADLYAVRESEDMGVQSAALHQFQCGVLVINRPLLGPTVHRQLLAMTRSISPYDNGDQGVVNHFLRHTPGVTAAELDPRYNVMVLARKHGRWDRFQGDVRILHFVNRYKPWSPYHRYDWLYDEELKRIWDEAYRPLASPPGAGSAPAATASP